MGAVVNIEPKISSLCIAEVPFVDVMNTMLDASIPLTTGEYEEWGNPNSVDPEARHIIKLIGNTLQVTNTIAVAVAKAARINLIDNCTLPPLFHCLPLQTRMTTLCPFP